MSNPNVKRKWFVLYINPYNNRQSRLWLNSDNYNDALRIAECFIGSDAIKYLYYQDFTIND